MDFSCEFEFEETAYNVSMPEENFDMNSSCFSLILTQEEQLQETQESLETMDELDLPQDKFDEELFSNEALHTIVINKARSFFESKAKLENKLFLNQGLLQYEKFYSNVLMESLEFLESQCQAIKGEEGVYKHKLDQVERIDEYLGKNKEVFKHFLDFYVKDNESKQSEYFLLVQKVTDLSIEVDKIDSEYVKQVEDKNKELEGINSIFKEKSEKYEKTLSDLQRKLEKSHTTLKEMENLYDENEKKLQLIEQNNFDVKNKIDKLNLEYNNEVVNLKNLTSKITEIKLKIQDVQLNKRNNPLKLKIAYFEQRHNQYLEKETNLLNKIKSNVNVISEKIAKKESLEVENTKLQNLKNDKAQRLEEIQQKILSLEKINAEKKNNFLNKKYMLEIELNTLKYHCDELNKSLIIEEENKSKRTAKIAQLKKNFGARKEENIQLKETVNQQNFIIDSENKQQRLISESHEIKQLLENRNEELNIQIQMLDRKKKSKIELVERNEQLKQRKQGLSEKGANNSKKTPESKISTKTKTGGILKSPGTPKTTPTKTVTFKRSLSPTSIASSSFEDLLKSSLENLKKSKLTPDKNLPKKRRFDLPERYD